MITLRNSKGNKDLYDPKLTDMCASMHVFVNVNEDAVRGCMQGFVGYNGVPPCPMNQK